MSNLWVNIRFGAYHFQVGRDRPWITIMYNDYHSMKTRGPNFKWFAIYEFPGINTDPGC